MPIHSIRGAGVTLSVTVEGEGPLVILMHGWPELGLSWRHQIPALAAAGFRVAVPDMRGYGASDKPDDAEAYTLDTIADDMHAIAASLGAERWVAVGHDWGAPAAWRCALRFPDSVAGVFCLSVPHARPPLAPFLQIIDALYPDQFFYIRYFQEPGVAEAEFAQAGMASALKRVFYMGSGEGVAARSGRHVPRNATMLASLDDPPPGPLSFMSDEELHAYASAFEAGGMRGPLNWYRNFDRNAADARAYGDNIIRQPAGFLAGDRELVLAMLPRQLENMRAATADLRIEKILPGAGHWIQQERPQETNETLIVFLRRLENFA
jgi:pimeloyl-ACP methyl ester carboxylesterase